MLLGGYCPALPLMTRQTVDFVRERLKASGPNTPLSSICADVCDACCAETTGGDGTGLDNVTVVIVALTTTGAAELMGGAGSAAGATSSSSAEDGSGFGEMECSDDGKRKQGGEVEGGAAGRSGKQMRAAEAAVGAGTGGGNGE